MMSHRSVSPVPATLTADGETIAYLQRAGKSPGVLWLGGFRSDMTGTKAQALDDWAGRQGRAFTRFDYSGHGQSSGAFREGTISRWLNDALAILDQACTGPQVLAGSSMGGWIALLAARLRPDKVRGLLLIAPAPDFTEDLMWAEFSDEIRREIMEKGEWLYPSAYGEDAYPITRALIEDGRKHLLLGAPLALSCPVRVVHGMKDADVPWRHALKLVERLSGNPVLTLAKEGDHRLSTAPALVLLEQILESLVVEAEGA